MQEILTVLNIMILLMQLYLRAEIKRLDEKIEILFKRTDKIENQVYCIKK